MAVPKVQYIRSRPNRTYTLLSSRHTIDVSNSIDFTTIQLATVLSVRLMLSVLFNQTRVDDD